MLRVLSIDFIFNSKAIRSRMKETKKEKNKSDGLFYVVFIFKYNTARSLLEIHHHSVLLCYVAAAAVAAAIDRSIIDRPIACLMCLLCCIIFFST